MEDSENIDVIDDITYYTEKFFKEIETLLKKLEKDEIFLKVDLTDEAVHD
jgi:2,3-bisphosphoglycerate-independent phosphoglycerate mutase